MGVADWMPEKNMDMAVRSRKVVAAQIDALPYPQEWKTQDYALRPELVEEVINEFGGEVPVLDAFATSTNKRFPKFWDEQKDAFSQNWGRSGGLLWMNPPSPCWTGWLTS